MTSSPPAGASRWRDSDREVDFVVAHGARIWAIEVKSARPGKTSGLEAFRKRYPQAKAGCSAAVD